jgi:cytochrome c oxidase subunit 1
VGLHEERREVLFTTALDAIPHRRVELPGPSAWTFFAALGTTVGLAVLIFTPWGLPLGTLLATAPFIAWAWPRTGGSA